MQLVPKTRGTMVQRPRSFLTSMQPIAGGEGKHGEADGEERVGAGPELFVDGEDEAPELSGGEADEAGGDQAAQQFGGIGAEAANPLAGGDAEEGIGDGGKGAEDALGIACPLVEAPHHEVAVEPGDEVAIGIEQGNVYGGDSEAGDGNKAQEQPITGEKRGDDRPASARAGPQIKHRGGKITERDALQDSGNAPGCEMVVGEGIDQQADGKDDGGAAQDVRQQAQARRIAGGMERR